MQTKKDYKYRDPRAFVNDRSITPRMPWLKNTKAPKEHIHQKALYKNGILKKLESALETIFLGVSITMIFIALSTIIVRL